MKNIYIQELDKIKRKEFIELINKKYNIENKREKEEMINSKFPFIINLNNNTLSICESITVCACLSNNKRIINITDFLNMI